MRTFINIVEDTQDGIDGIHPIIPADIPVLLEMVVQTFSGHGMSRAEIVVYTNEVTDWNLSRKMTLNGKIVGGYLLGKANVRVFTHNPAFTCSPDLESYEGKRGLAGVALMLLPEARGTGLGKKLIEYPRTLGYDFIIGEHIKSLDNIDHWLKRRRIVAESDECWVTLADL